MKYIYSFLFSISVISIFYSQENKCDMLERGVFSIYENDEEIGMIFRENGLQLEIYKDNKNEIVKAKYRNTKGCKFLLNSYATKEDLDTITWAISYEYLDNRKFNFRAEPHYENIGYTYFGCIQKLSDTIEDETIRKIFLDENK